MKQETKPAFLVETNTDVTEGRGYMFPLYITETEATARRLGRGRFFQGLDCPILQIELIKVNGQWYGPVHIQESSEADDLEQSRLDKERQVIARAKELGLTEEEIKILKELKNEPTT